MPKETRENAPAIDSRWWVDMGKPQERARASGKGAPRTAGPKFYDLGYDFDQEQAKEHLTDLNLKFLDQVDPKPGEWQVIRMLTSECVPSREIARLKRHLPLPPGARGVIVDSGRSVRCIMTGEAPGERILEFTLGEECSFDCWIRGEWVCEEAFRDLEDALRRAPRYVNRYLAAQAHPG